MKYRLVDNIIEQSDDRIVVMKQVTLAEEYLADHFPAFPVLPGVMMIETLVQAARMMLAPRGDARLVLGEVKAVKFGNMVRPGEQLIVEVTLNGENDGLFTCKGIGRVCRAGAMPDQPPETAVSGKFTMRRLLIAAAS